MVLVDQIFERMLATGKPIVVAVNKVRLDLLLLLCCPEGLLPTDMRSYVQDTCAGHQHVGK